MSCSVNEAPIISCDAGLDNVNISSLAELILGYTPSHKDLSHFGLQMYYSTEGESLGYLLWYKEKHIGVIEVKDNVLTYKPV